MQRDQPPAPDPVASLGRASVEGWLAALDAGRECNRVTTAELLALLEAGARAGAPTEPLADILAETAGAADSLARAQQTWWYLTGATLFGMAPRKTGGEPVRIAVDD